MKNEFILAFNEICESRGLPKEDVFEALKTALVSAFRRDSNLSNLQDVQVEIDPRTGEPTIYSEKEIVDSIIDNRTEVLMEEARRNGHAEAEMGDIVLIDSTTPSFGRIAAQTAKQVLLQRVREAERDQLFDDFSGREGELVNGTVQSISGQHITIGLGRTEAILPKGHQVRGERYRPHDKIRVYVLEVRRTNRGPQIYVSRNHRNLLRRLLELEVPEIYNGQVDIKSIAREAGQRSKVAVQALQPGVDPVGACVGMRGVRIQSIVRELNDEKIDVIEWDPDQRVFIAKALSPARVSQVFLEEHPDDGKTAVVIVPDDQLSLAIGREGQNARLAAKLTGWRIDIKSLAEAATDSLNDLDHPDANPQVTQDEAFIANIEQILEKKKQGRPVTSEDYRHLERLVINVEGKIIAARSIEHAEVRRQRAIARRAIPEVAWSTELDSLDLPGRIHNLLLDNEIETAGEAWFSIEQNRQALLSFRGFDEEMLKVLEEAVEAYKASESVKETTVVEATPAEDIDPGDLEIAAAIAEATGEPAAPSVDDEILAEIAAVQDGVEAMETAVVEETPEAIEPEPEPIIEAIEEPEPEAVVEIAAVQEEEEEEEEIVDAIDDLSRSLVDAPVKPKKPKKKQPKIKVVRTVEESTEEEDDDDRAKERRRQLVFDEDAGEVVAKRRRKGSRSRPEWEEYDIDDF